MSGPNQGQPYPRKRRRRAHADQEFPAGFVKMSDGRGEMLWHGHDPYRQGATSTQTAADFPAHAQQFYRAVPLSLLGRRVPCRVVRTNRSVTELPVATYQKGGTLRVYRPNDPDRWVEQWRHLDEQPNVWASYRDLNRRFRYMFGDLVVAKDPVLGWDVRAGRDLPEGREFPYYGRIVVGHVGLEHAFDVGDDHLVAQADLQETAAVINDPMQSTGLMQYVNEASSNDQINARFAAPPPMNVCEGMIVIAAVCVTTQPIQAGQSLRVCYNDPEEQDMAFGAGVCRASDGHPMRVLNEVDKAGNPIMYPIAPACVAGKDMPPCQAAAQPMAVVSNAKPAGQMRVQQPIQHVLHPRIIDSQQRPLKRSRQMQPSFDNVQ